MNTITAYSISLPAFSLLQNTSTATVHTLFAQVCNLITPDKTILSIVTPAIGNQPCALVIPHPITTHLSQGMPASLHPHAIQFPTLTINIASATHWQPQPLWHRLPPSLHTIMPPISIPNCLPLSALDTLATALHQQNPTLCQAGAYLLLGLGQGLTPTGDDFLMGVIYGLWATLPANRVFPLTQALIHHAPTRTTTLSTSWLRQAAQGNASQPWHTLVHNLSQQINIEEAIAGIQAIGHSSGTDALAGFYWTLSQMASS